MRIPYTRVVNGNRFFEPNAAMRAAGFRPMPLGPDEAGATPRALSLRKMDGDPAETGHLHQRRPEADQGRGKRYPSLPSRVDR